MPDETDDLPEQVRVRREKYDRLVGAGADPYPVGYPRTTTIAALRAAHTELPPDTDTGEVAGIAGRVVFKRDTGKLCFATLREGGADVQVMLSLAEVGDDGLAAWKADVDLGDQVGVTGRVITSRRGELSVMATSYAITSKSLQPPPVQHKELSEETRVRQRYVDLWSNPDARRRALQRVAVVRALRDTFHAREFLEVETPVLQVIHGGANARPYATHMIAWDLPLYLRIAPELWLKRAVVGGLDRVFEINRNFRNEGVDATHANEFAMLEAYEAYGDYDTMAELTRELVLAAAVAANGSTSVPRPDGTSVDLGAPWESITLHEAVSRQVREQVTPDTSEADLRALAARHEVDVADKPTAGDIALTLFDKLVEHTLHAPTFVRDYPVECTPAHPRPPRRPAPDRVVGSHHLRDRARHGVLGTGRSRRAAAAAHRPVAARGRWRRRGDAARRGLPARARGRHATDRRHGHRPAAPRRDRRQLGARDHPVPPREARMRRTARA